jgi:high frequency lysogenization protein
MIRTFVLAVELLKLETMNKLKQQTLALASILQTSALVDQLASTGTCDGKSSEVSLKSIITNSTNVEEVFDSPKDLSIGLGALTKAFGKKTKSMQDIIFYSLALINLEKKTDERSKINVTNI